VVTGLDADECQVWWARVEGDIDRAVTALLDPAERDRRQAIRHAPSRAVYGLAHATARLVCGRLLGTEPAALRFTATCRHCGGPHGRPGVDLPPGHPGGDRLWLSLAHSGDRAVIAVAWDNAIGVDVETVALRGADLPLIALSEAERDEVASRPEADRLAAFIRYWTRKEAAVKATGDGLLAPPGRITLSPPDAPAEIREWTGRPPPHAPLFLTDLDPGPGYRAALATLGRPLRVVAGDAATLLR
jgi:4'-phosphopantetheinyl transferase